MGNAKNEMLPIAPALVIRIVGHQVAAVHVCRELAKIKIRVVNI